MILYSNLFTIITNPEVLLISKLVFSFDDSFLDSPSSQGQLEPPIQVQIVVIGDSISSFT